MSQRYFIFGLQRSGTNYLHNILKVNFSAASCYRESGIFKHSLYYPPYQPNPDKPKPLSRNDITFLIYKNPYLWVESIAFRDAIDYVETQTIFPATDIPEDTDYQIGELKLNVINLAKTWKTFHRTWFLEENTTYAVKYEDLLSVQGRESLLQMLLDNHKWIKLLENWGTPNRQIIRWSENFNDDSLEYYLEGTPKYLTKKQIDKITEIINPGIIQKMGYKLL